MSNTDSSRCETAIDFAPGMLETINETARLAPLGPIATAQFWAVGADEVYATEEGCYPGAAGQQQHYRLYRASASSAPVLVYVHGGGWVGGSIDLNEPAARALASQSGCHVFSISYRLAPDHPYPAGLEDCKAAVQWLMAGRGPVDLETQCVAIGGASAGANLALSTALSLDRADFKALLLFYGVFDDDFETPSYQLYADGPGLSRARMQELFQLYDPLKRRLTDPLVTPLHAQLEGIPHTIMVAAQCDVLRSDSERLHKHLRDVAVDVDFWIEPGVTHGYINRGRTLPSARTSLSQASQKLAAIMNKGTANEN
ncbi:MAG: alpha/beta hydrolase [Granulosicoccus sp.]